MSRSASRILAGLVMALAGAWPAAAGGPPFSHMTLNGLTQVAISVEDLEPALANYGLGAQVIEQAATRRLEAGGLAVVPYGEALTAPAAGLLRIRVITNQNAHGFYHLGVKLEVREKIPLGNAAGGFVSQAVWSAGENGLMQPNEVEKVTAILDALLGEFLTAHRAQQ